MKNIPIVAMCAVTLFLCFGMNSAFYLKISHRIDSIDSKLIEVDGRRNAQYGILKNSLKIIREDLK